MSAAATCELIREGFLGQPVNALTSVALALGGLVVVRQQQGGRVGIAMVAAGIGSFLSHGPMPPYADLVHDVTLATLILVIAGLGTRWESWAVPAGMVAFGLAFATAPALGGPVVSALTVIAIALILTRDRSRRTLAPLGLLAVVAVVGRLGDTGWPLCDPTSIWQPHALWHLGAATAVTWWALGQVRQPTETLTRSPDTSYAGDDPTDR